ncbi:MAG: hypothetical protein JWO80_5172 [Bryobacterales bacterium]|nr:hypothetical protein [Bryobacterales bacterium]
MKHIPPRIAALAVCAVLLTAAYQRANNASMMTLAAKQFLDSLTPEEKAQATFTLDSAERENWFFTPVPRKGLALRDMTPAQQHLATALLTAGLSQQGLIKAETIMSMEDVLKVMEKDDGERRNPGKYYFSIFGTPSDTGQWGYRVEGHHLSQNYTISNGRVIDAPSFFGSNPAEVREGPRKGVRLLAQEEDRARELLNALDAGQKKTCIITTDAYKEIVTSNSKRAQLDGKPAGLPLSKMNAKQTQMLMDLLDVYASNLPQQMAEARMAQVKQTERDIYFAWAGVAERGGPHYYRIQSPAFLIEYDNTQNDANHIHTVWRDWTNDFGADLLKQHYNSSHNQ